MPRWSACPRPKARLVASPRTSSEARAGPSWSCRLASERPRAHLSSMGVYILASHISSGSVQSPGSLQSLAREVMNRVREECPEVRWLHNFAVCGPYDYIDVLEAPTLESAMKVSVLTRTYGRARTDLWPALGW